MGIYFNPNHTDFFSVGPLWPCEKISVNSTTVIKNDIASGLKNGRSIFFTVYNKYRNLSSFFNSQVSVKQK